jgi:hypothetical protein
MPSEEIDGVPIWYEEHGDSDGPLLVALHGGILTFEGSFCDVLAWLAPSNSSPTAVSPSCPARSTPR